jgi:hypothetical protein
MCLPIKSSTAGPSIDDVCKKNIFKAHCKSSSSLSHPPHPSSTFTDTTADALNTKQGGLTVSLLLGCIVLRREHAFKEVFWSVRVMVR